MNHIKCIKCNSCTFKFTPHHLFLFERKKLSYYQLLNYDRVNTNSCIRMEIRKFFASINSVSYYLYIVYQTFAWKMTMSIKKMFIGEDYCSHVCSCFVFSFADITTHNTYQELSWNFICCHFFSRYIRHVKSNLWREWNETSQTKKLKQKKKKRKKVYSNSCLCRPDTGC